MMNSRHLSGPARSPRSRSTADRVVSAGLATAACVGLIGVIGVRSMEQSAAADSSTGSVSAPDAAATDTVLSSGGLTQAQLDEYAAQLQAEATTLDAYRAKLVKTAKKLKASTRQRTAGATAPSTVTRVAPKPVARPVAKPAPKPAPKPAAKPAPKPQSKTKSS